MHIYIFGASGSGVTTLGKALAGRLNFPYFDSDTYFWHPSDPLFTIRRDKAERNALIASHLQQHENWILGGSVINWGDDVFPPFDLVVFLWLPPEIRMQRLKDREFGRYGDVIFTDPERNRHYNEFLAWSEDYDNDTGIATRTLNAHEAWLAKSDAPLLQLRGDMTVEERVQMVLKRLEIRD